MLDSYVSSSNNCSYLRCSAPMFDTCEVTSPSSTHAPISQNKETDLMGSRPNFTFLNYGRNAKSTPASTFRLSQSNVLQQNPNCFKSSITFPKSMQDMLPRLNTAQLEQKPTSLTPSLFSITHSQDMAMDMTKFGYTGNIDDDAVDKKRYNAASCTFAPSSPLSTSLKSLFFRTGAPSSYSSASNEISNNKEDTDAYFIPELKVNTVKYTSRYKTELCRPFIENGECKYANRCQFAHGFNELRSILRHDKYKTELCRTFHSTGFCPYGPRCHFVHNGDLLEKLQAGGNLRAIQKLKKQGLSNSCKSQVLEPVPGDALQMADRLLMFRNLKHRNSKSVNNSNNVEAMAKEEMPTHMEYQQQPHLKWRNITITNNNMLSPSPVNNKCDDDDEEEEDEFEFDESCKRNSGCLSHCSSDSSQSTDSGIEEHLSCIWGDSIIFPSKPPAHEQQTFSDYNLFPPRVKKSSNRLPIFESITNSLTL